ncbi:universal stress protein [Mycobacterium sp. CBMA293]|uniref:universal stress protein n=1 Tax=unclassified Mycolicibacterium TaxID=2636767 RepID=UPI0012DD0ADB|nr:MULTISPECIES: universal stress protein [unclassified Mycolicibacterium]MUL47120.1 universal stress protein [Mycolicibacterium sp. CBMA 360]MUL58497.1 universal stress protein [Mycolicibacterium sp. CBMA 335]MUL73955.1 universal stress protein [Mycolicibacterium sp. CBMA 311]MUL93380.1 universal stress protein [Mycolicibacterium sp. CBMA 230]MUM04595.1 hypothetical protein [Mycolicibacterium sp. CBMA 213]
MSTTDQVKPVVVGVDGSKHALRAARWAALEAASRDATLRLVYVIDSGEADRHESVERAQHALHEAWEAVADTHLDVKLESEITSGAAADCLVEESRHASIVCVGHRGTHDTPEGPRGSTAVELAKRAPGSVAIIRRAHHGFDQRKWIVAVLDESDSATAVLKDAQEEAAWRKAPILILEPWSHSKKSGEISHPVRTAVDRYLKDSGNSHIQSVTLPAPGHLSNLLRQSACIDQLVIVPGDYPELVAELTGDETRETLRDSDCSLMFVR